LSNPNYCNTNIDPGTPNVLSASNGTLTNGSGNDSYANSNACYWRIEPKNASGVWVDVTEFALERGDELSIYAHDHKFIQGVKFTDRIARYTIDNPPTGMVSTDKEKIYIMFRSDNDLNNKGWTLKWGTDVSISEQVSGISSLSIYPNPANDFVTIDFITEENVSHVNAIITDYTGRKINSFDLNQSSQRVDVSQLAKGIYVLTLTTNKGKINKKFVVQ
ncbi:MAG: T9SS type A sorting domain-containing protein, partial [Bacteroidales bacterium]|nr:T9SS type A sorting domain-containing protein [Bacteroidales bacterium]